MRLFLAVSAVQEDPGVWNGRDLIPLVAPSDFYDEFRLWEKLKGAKVPTDIPSNAHATRCFDHLNHFLTTSTSNNHDYSQYFSHFRYFNYFCYFNYFDHPPTLPKATVLQLL